MTVTEIKQALGSWAIRLRADTPRSLLTRATFLGHVAFVPGRLDPVQYGDNLLTKARYVGVVREQQTTGDYYLGGVGMAYWLGDEDGKGDVFETAVSLSAVTFADAMNALLPAGGAVTAGTYYSVAGTYTGRHQWETPRSAITYVTDTMGAEWRVTGDGKLDAGPIANLYNTSPTAIVMARKAARDLRLSAIPGQAALARDVVDYTTRVVLLAEGEGDAIATGEADGPATPYKDIHGNAARLVRLASESDTATTNADARAQLVLNHFLSPRNNVNLSSSQYDIKGDFVVGDYLWVYDPDRGFLDTAQEVIWEGVPINPVALRCVEMTWPIPAGWTVAYRDAAGVWLDLSQYYSPETGDTTIVVGDFGPSLSSLGIVTPGDRPAVDTSVPAVPVFGAFNRGSYVSAASSTTKSVLQTTWTTPLNIDGSTVLDGDHYEIRYRVNQFIGYEVRWADLSGYTTTFIERFDASATDSWPAGWTNGGGAADDYQSTGGVGQHIVEVTNSSRRTWRGSVTDGLVTWTVKTDVLASGAALVSDAMMRYDGSDTMYCGRIRFNTDQTISAVVYKRVSATQTDIMTATVPGLTHVAGVEYAGAFQVIGQDLRIRIWRPDTQAEPGSWHAYGSGGGSIAGPGAAGMRTLRFTGNTSGTTIFSHDNITLVDLDPAGGYRWGDLNAGGAHWGNPLTNPVDLSPEWLTSYVAWGTNTVTLVELTPGVEYDIQIRAVDSAGNFGAWSPSSFVETVGDLIPPSTPAPPEVASSLVAVQVTHRLGMASGGTFNLEPDLDHLEVHVGGSTDFLANEGTLVGKLTANSTLLQGQIPVVGTFAVSSTVNIYIKVVAVDRAGNKSGASASATTTATLIDDQHISALSVSKLTAGTITASSILAGLLEVAAGGNIKLTEGSIIVNDALGRTLIEFGKRSLDAFGGYGMSVFDAVTGNVMARFGEIEDPNYGYGVEAVNAAGDLVSLSTLAFGMAAASEPGGFSQPGSSSSNYDSAADGLGPSVDAYIGTSGRCIVILGAQLGNPPISTDGTSETYMSVQITGATTVTATSLPAQMFSFDTSAAANFVMYMKGSNAYVITGLNPGLHHFEAKYRYFNTRAGSSATINNRTLIIIPY